MHPPICREERKLVHIYYKLLRPTGWLELTMDCAPKRFPLEGNTMACTPVEAADRLAVSQAGVDLFAAEWNLGGKSLGDAFAATVGRVLAYNTTLQELK